MMLHRIAIAFAALLCGCATQSRTTLDHYQWAPEYFDIVFPSGGWRYLMSLTSNGEHHEFYERRFLFCSDRLEQVSTSSYLSTRAGIAPPGVENIFRSVTNSLSKQYWLSVVINWEIPERNHLGMEWYQQKQRATSKWYWEDCQRSERDILP